MKTRKPPTDGFNPREDRIRLVLNLREYAEITDEHRSIYGGYLLGAVDGMMSVRIASELGELILLRHVRETKSHLATGLTWQGFLRQRGHSDARRIGRELRRLEKLEGQYVALSGRLGDDGARERLARYKAAIDSGTTTIPPL